jgi:hypothetical protein
MQVEMVLQFVREVGIPLASGAKANHPHEEHAQLSHRRQR